MMILKDISDLYFPLSLHYLNFLKTASFPVQFFRTVLLPISLPATTNMTLKLHFLCSIKQPKWNQKIHVDYQLLFLLQSSSLFSYLHFIPLKYFPFCLHRTTKSRQMSTRHSALPLSSTLSCDIQSALPKEKQLLLLTHCTTDKLR